MTLADRVVVLRDGQIEQVGTPLELYDRPANQFVAQFIGTPQMNVVKADELPQLRAAVGSVPSGGFIGLRPENLCVSAAGTGQVQGKVELVEALGAETLIYVNTAPGVPARGAAERTHQPARGRCGRHRDRRDLGASVRRAGPCVRRRHALNSSKAPAMSSTSPSVILHLGLGSFHRAHQAVYAHELNATGDQPGRWPAATLRPDMADTIAALQAQGGAYTLETVTPAGERRYTRIESIREVVPYDAGPGRARADRRRSGHAHHLVHGHRGRLLPRRAEPPGPRIRRPQVGPSGRPRRPPRRHHLCRAHGHPARAQPSWRGPGDLAELRQPPAQRRALPRRPAPVHRPRRRQGPARLGRVEHDQPERHGRPDHAASHAGRARAREAATGRDDPAAVMGESFIQWVIEDDFCNGRPAWERVGVQMVESVAPYEEAKIRVLNATHSCIAWAGTLVGYRYIHEGTHDERIRRFAHDYVTDDVIPCLQPEPDRPGELPRRGARALRQPRHPRHQPARRDGRFLQDPGLHRAHHPRKARRAANRSTAWRCCPRSSWPTWGAGTGNRSTTPTRTRRWTRPRHMRCASRTIRSARSVATKLLWGPQAGDERLVAAVRAATRRVDEFVAGRAP